MRIFFLLTLTTGLVYHTESVILGHSTTIHRAPFLAYIFGHHKKEGYASRTSGILVHERYVLMSARRCHE